MLFCFQKMERRKNNLVDNSFLLIRITAAGSADGKAYAEKYNNLPKTLYTLMIRCLGAFVRSYFGALVDIFLIIFPISLLKP